MFHIFRCCVCVDPNSNWRDEQIPNKTFSFFRRRPDGCIRARQLGHQLHPVLLHEPAVPHDVRAAIPAAGSSALAARAAARGRPRRGDGRQRADGRQDADDASVAPALCRAPQPARARWRLADHRQGTARRCLRRVATPLRSLRLSRLHQFQNAVNVTVLIFINETLTAILASERLPILHIKFAFFPQLYSL